MIYRFRKLNIFKCSFYIFSGILPIQGGFELLCLTASIFNFQSNILYIMLILYRNYIFKTKPDKYKIE